MRYPCLGVGAWPRSLSLAVGALALGLFVSTGRADAHTGTEPTVTVTGTTPSVAWDTGDGSLGQVYVSVDGGSENLVAEGPRGSAEVPWVAPSKRYEFTLYAGLRHQTRLTGAVVGPTVDAPRQQPAPTAAAAVLDMLVGTHVIPIGLVAVALLARGRLAQAVAIAALGWALWPVVTAVAPPLQQQPFPDSAEYADAAAQLAHGNGYVTYVHGNGPEPPRYPPGFSLALTPFAALGGDYPTNVAVGPKVFAALYLSVTVAAVWRVGGPAAGAVAAIVLGSSPFARLSATLVLSDALAACLTVPIALLARAPNTRRTLQAGVLIGVITTIRLSAGLALPALLWATRARSRLAVLAGAAPLLAALGVYQWQMFGSPFRTGYDYWLPDTHNFGLAYATASPPFGDGPWVLADRLGGDLMRWVCPCISGGPQATAPDVVLYPAVLLGLFWTFTPPLVTVVGLLYLWSKRQESSARFTLVFVALNLAFYCVYFYQGTRFMAAPATLLAMYSAVGITQWTRAGFARLQVHGAAQGWPLTRLLRRPMPWRWLTPGSGRTVPSTSVPRHRSG